MSEYSKKPGLPFSKDPIWDKLRRDDLRDSRIYVNIILKRIFILMLTDESVNIEILSMNCSTLMLFDHFLK